MNTCPTCFKLPALALLAKKALKDRIRAKKELLRN